MENEERQQKLLAGKERVSVHRFEALFVLSVCATMQDGCGVCCALQLRKFQQKKKQRNKKPLSRDTVVPDQVVDSVPSQSSESELHEISQPHPSEETISSNLDWRASEQVCAF